MGMGKLSHEKYVTMETHQMLINASAIAQGLSLDGLVIQELSILLLSALKSAETE